MKTALLIALFLLGVACNREEPQEPVTTAPKAAEPDAPVATQPPEPTAEQLPVVEDFAAEAAQAIDAARYKDELKAIERELDDERNAR